MSAFAKAASLIALLLSGANAHALRPLPRPSDLAKQIDEITVLSRRAQAIEVALARIHNHWARRVQFSPPNERFDCAESHVAQVVTESRIFLKALGTTDQAIGVRISELEFLVAAPSLAPLQTASRREHLTGLLDEYEMRQRRLTEFTKWHERMIEAKHTGVCPPWPEPMTGYPALLPGSQARDVESAIIVVPNRGNLCPAMPVYESVAVVSEAVCAAYLPCNCRPSVMDPGAVLSAVSDRDQNGSSSAR